MSKASIRVDVISDVICPWCFLGKRRLDKAIAEVPELQVEVYFHPFFLDPTLPPEGIGRHEYLSRKFGEERLKTLHDPLITAGEEDGVPYHFDKITRTPNTMNPHRLIRWALESKAQLTVVEELFLAYWRDGKDIGDESTLVDIARAAGMDADQVSQDFKTDRDVRVIIDHFQSAQKMGISGVPTFIFDNRYGLPGAQPAAQLAEQMRKIAGQS